MTTLTAFCPVCQKDTVNNHYIDHNGEHVIECQEPISLVRACTACVSDTAHKTACSVCYASPRGADDHEHDQAEVLHGNEEYRVGHIHPDLHLGAPYVGPCKSFIKLPATVVDEAEVLAYLVLRKQVNDRSQAPKEACKHFFSSPAARVTDSVCDNCGLTHGAIFP